MTFFYLETRDTTLHRHVTLRCTNI